LRSQLAAQIDNDIRFTVGRIRIYVEPGFPNTMMRPLAAVFKKRRVELRFTLFRGVLVISALCFDDRANRNLAASLSLPDYWD